MTDITQKTTTLRTAVAEARVRVGLSETMEAVINNQVPKGNVFEMSKTAGLFAVKRTHDMIPDCHPLPIEFASVTFDVDGLEICIRVTVKSIYKTGVEVEAMHGASIVALTVYDMLKPIDKNIEIQHIKLINKTGGKSDWGHLIHPVNAAVVIISDAIADGSKEAKVGGIIKQKLEKFQVSVSDYSIIPDDESRIRDMVLNHTHSGVPLLLLAGGTGLTPRDKTTDVLKTMLHREVPGIAEAMRSYGQQRTPQAMISRSIAGYIDKTLVIAIPGSVNGASESLQVLFPYILYIINKKNRK